MLSKKICIFRSSEGTFIGQRGTWERVNRRDFLVESCSNLRFGSVDCSLRFPMAGIGNRDGDDSSSAMACRLEEIETQAMDENFLMLPPTGRNSSSSSSSSYRTMIASAVTQVMDTSLLDELGDDTIDDGDKEAEVGNCSGNGLQASEEDLLGDDETHSEATLTPPQSPSHTNFPAPEAVVILSSLSLDVVEVDDDGSSQESADLFHVDVAIADTLVDDDLEDDVAVGMHEGQFSSFRPIFSDVQFMVLRLIICLIMHII